MYMGIFESMKDEYMKERAVDVKDVGNRILNSLLGNGENEEVNLKENTIIVAHDLTPSDTDKIDKSKVIGFVTNIGGRTSHSSIMARTLEIPAVVDLKDITRNVKNGDVIIIDGNKG